MKRITHFLIIAVAVFTLAALAGSPQTLAGDAERVMVQFEPGKKAALSPVFCKKQAATSTTRLTI